MMNRFWNCFVLLLLSASLAFADDKPAEKKPAAEKKVEAKAEADPEAKAKQAAQSFEALGQVLEVFGAALGGRPIDLEAPAAEMLLGVGVDVAVEDQVAEGGEAGGDPLEQQFLQQFRQLSKTELNFVRAVCKPNKEQDKLIADASKSALKTAVKKFAEIQKKMQQGIRAGQEPQWPDPRQLMSEVLLKSVKQTLSTEAAKRYEVELERRAAARKRAALLNFVAKLDKDLVLTADQRGKLTESLSSNWKDSWCHQLEVFMYGDTYLPVLPDAHVLPVLTEKQKQIWRGLPKQQNMIWGWAGMGFVQAGEVEEIGDEAIRVEEAVEAKNGAQP